jgi:hypothetical protein
VTATAASRRRAWKRDESEIARLLGGERVPVSGRQRGYRPDVEHPWLALEVKSWARLPGRVAEAMDQAEKAAAFAKRREGVEKLPLAVIHAKGSHRENSLVVMRLDDFLAWFGGQPIATALQEAAE